MKAFDFFILGLLAVLAILAILEAIICIYEGVQEKRAIETQAEQEDEVEEQIFEHVDGTVGADAEEKGNDEQ